MALKEEIAAFIRERRLELNITMEELAILVYGNSKMNSQISNIENGRRVPSIDTLELILEKLNSRIEIKKN